MNRLRTIQVTEQQQHLIREAIISRITVDENGCWITRPSRTGEPETGRRSGMKLFGIYLGCPAWAALGWKSNSLPNGSAVCHSCDTPRCANPNHLWIGDDGENAIDAFQKGRRKSPFVNHGPRAKHIELALGRRRIMMRWHGDKWPEAYRKQYGEIPVYLHKHVPVTPTAARQRSSQHSVATHRSTASPRF